MDQLLVTSYHSSAKQREATISPMLAVDSITMPTSSDDPLKFSMVAEVVDGTFVMLEDTLTCCDSVVKAC